MKSLRSRQKEAKALLRNGSDRYKNMNSTRKRKLVKLNGRMTVMEQTEAIHSRLLTYVIT